MQATKLQTQSIDIPASENNINSKLGGLRLGEFFGQQNSLRRPKISDKFADAVRSNQTSFSKSVAVDSLNVRLDSNPDAVPLKLFANQAFGVFRDRAKKLQFVKPFDIGSTSTVSLGPQKFYTPEPETGLEGYFSNKICLSEEQKASSNGWFK